MATIKLLEVLERYDISSTNASYDENNVFSGYEEFEHYSPAGEDFIMTIHYDGSPESLAEGLAEYADEFDPEEHAAMWYEAKDRVAGVPKSLKDLLEDAHAIKKNLQEASKAVNAALLSEEDPNKDSTVLQEILLDTLITNCIENYNFEVVRNNTGDVKVESGTYEDAFFLRFGEKMFQISVGEVR